MAPPSVGFVYILTNPSFRDVVKVGFSSRVVEDRVSELSTAVPTDFEVAYRATTMKPREVERETHEILHPLRVDSGKEFFRTNVEAAREAVSQAALYVTGLPVWSQVMAAQNHPFYLHAGTRNVLPLEADQWFIWYRHPGIFARRPDIVDIWQTHSHGDALEIIGSQTPEYLAGFSDSDPLGDTDPIPYLDRRQAAPNGHIIGRERLVPGDRLQWISCPAGTDSYLSALFEARDYCQVVGRTWSPKTSEDGWPLLLTSVTAQEMPQPVVRLARKARRLPPPRTWEPADDHGAAGRGFGTQSRPPSQWMNVLLDRDR